MPRFWHLDVDVTKEKQVAAALAEINQSMPPLRGIIHAAGVLDDDLLLNQRRSRFVKVLSPKVAGAWNLHALTQDIQLEFFVLFSSVTSLLGSYGQGNYAAANAFLDALAAYRRHNGLPAVSINWGPWSQVGMAADSLGRGTSQIVRAGLGLIEPLHGLKTLERILQDDLTQVVVLLISWPQLKRQFTAGGKPRLLAKLAGESLDNMRVPHKSTPQSEVLIRLQMAQSGERKGILISQLQSVIVKILQLDPANPPRPQDELFELGMDSLMVTEFKYHLETEFSRTFPFPLIFEHSTVEALAERLSQEIPIFESQKRNRTPIGNHRLVQTGLTERSSAPPMESTYRKSARHVTDRSDCNTIMESLGVYLPPKAVSTKEVLRGCKRKIFVPIERMTGIQSRRMAGKTEFSIDLAMKAITSCLAKSKYNPVDIDLLICCNISRHDGPNRFSFEPSTSIKLKKLFGFHNALVFDIANACAGMFTAINIVDAFLKIGLIRCGMVVSGEYISHLTLTAQKEIKGPLDPRLACLTLGDAGAAVIMENSSGKKDGFHAIDMYTLGRYSQLCIAKATDKEHGGAIMLTNGRKLNAVAVKHSVMHATSVLKRCGWSFEDLQHIIMHQTSETVIRHAADAINSSLDKNICHDGNIIYNLAERGNTASTSHFVALWDNILNKRISSGDKVAFGIAASGLTTGTALYTLNDLPDRLLRMVSTNQRPQKTETGERSTCALVSHGQGVRIESVGTIPRMRKVKRDTIELLKVASMDCFAKSSYQRGDIDLLIHAGVYRNDFTSEPAIAALLAGELKINDVIKSQDEKKTFAFDVFNGSLGFLNACDVASKMIKAAKHKTAMVVAAEIENNLNVCSERLYGVAETATAVILDEDISGKTGFGTFLFEHFTDHIEALTSHAEHCKGKPYLQFAKDPRLEDLYVDCIHKSVRKLLATEELDSSEIAVILPPLISSSFVSKLSVKLNIARERFPYAIQNGKDLFTSSLPYALQYVQEKNLVKAGDIGLIIGVGSGIQVCCVIYDF